MNGIYQVSNLGRIKRLGYYRKIKPRGYTIHKHNMRTRYGKSVDQYTKNSTFVKTYECVNDVEPEYSATKVVACCKKKRNYHKNFIWIYHGETPVIPDRR